MRHAGEAPAGRLALILNLPTLVALACVLAYPIAFAGYLSFHEVSIRQLRSGEFPFVGLANFARLFQDEVFWLSLRHTLVFVAATVTLEVLILIPWAVPPVVNGLLWSVIANAQYGYLNRALHKLGLITDYFKWFGDH